MDEFDLLAFSGFLQLKKKKVEFALCFFDNWLTIMSVIDFNKLVQQLKVC